MLKSFNEMVKIDVMPFCDKRKAKDENGKTIEVPYLSWAKCKMLLHENGAEVVYFTPRTDQSGSYVFKHYETSDKNNRKTDCYFVSVDIHIDEKTYTMDFPLLNGSLVVYSDTLNQLRISNAHARAFVKGVAIYTGLGFSLWTGEKDTDGNVDDLSTHNIFAIKQRVEQLLTQKMQDGITIDDICKGVGLTRKRLDIILAAFGDINLLEERLKKL